MAHRPDLAISVSNYSRRYSTTPCANVLLDEVVLNFFKSPALWAGLFTHLWGNGRLLFERLAPSQIINDGREPKTRTGSFFSLV